MNKVEGLDTIKSGFRIEETSGEDLEELTVCLRDCYQNINEIIRGHKGILFGDVKKLKVEKPTSLTQAILLKGTGDVLQGKSVADIVQKHLFLTRAVADVVKKTTHQTFTTVIYPLSGTDISTAISYLNGDNTQLVTFDRRNIYALPLEKEKRRISELVKEALTTRLFLGYHEGDANLRFMGVAMELSLLGVDPESLTVVKREIIPAKRGEMPIFITDVQFTLPDGRKIKHTHFGGILLNDGYIRIKGDSLDSPYLRGYHLKKRITKAISLSNQILMLRKAGELYPGTTGMFYPLLPEGTIIVSDLGPMSGGKKEKDLFRELGLKGKDLIDCRTEETIKELERLDEETSYADNNSNPPYFGFQYGYLMNGLVDLSIDKLVFVN